MSDKDTIPAEETADDALEEAKGWVTINNDHGGRALIVTVRSEKDRIIGDDGETPPISVGYTIDDVSGAGPTDPQKVDSTVKIKR